MLAFRLTNLLIFYSILSASLIDGKQSFGRILFDATTPATTALMEDSEHSKFSPALKFLQHYQSNNPVVLLLDNTPSSYEDASKFYTQIKNATRINFMLMEFQERQVSPVIETTTNNEQRFSEILAAQLTYHSTFSIGNSKLNKSAVYFGISVAAKQLKANGAVVVFTNRDSYDEALAQVTLKYVRDLNIRVYIVWGKKVGATHDETILKEFARKSGGEFFLASKKLSEQNYQDFLDSLEHYSSAQTILSLKKLQYQHNLYFPIDSDVTSIHINIKPNLTTGILTTPSGKRINVLNEEEVAKFASGSFTRRDEFGGIHEIHLNTTRATTAAATSQDVGIWYFLVNNAAAYNVDVLAHTQLTSDAFVTFVNKTANSQKKKIVHLELNGDVSAINNVTLLNSELTPLYDTVNFTFLPNANTSEFQQIHSPKNEIKIDIDRLKVDPYYAIVDGKDSKGHNFKRLSYVTQNLVTDLFNIPKLTVDVALGSEIITEPNRRPEISFEVTNNHNRVTLVRFQVNDEKSMLVRMDPLYKWLSPHETTIVRVTMVTRPGVTSDTVTFTASGESTVHTKVLVEVGKGSLVSDNDDPWLDYKLLSKCNEVIGSCYNGAWSVEVRARDYSSGLLQLTSSPKGLYFNNEFVVGTRQEVIGYYVQSCCYPDFYMTAIDRTGHKTTAKFNAYRGPLGAGAIAAIVLGIVLLCLLIVLIVYCVLHPPSKSTSGSFDLPTYRAPTGRKF